MLACPTCKRVFARGGSEPLEARCPDDGALLVPERVLAALDTPLEPGAKVGEYQVEGVLGAGAFGAVYAGEQPLIGKRVAIKVLHKRLSGDAQAVGRFVAEARAVNRVRHRGIVDVFSFGALDDGRQYFVMERLEGSTLRERLERDGPPALDEAIEILRGVAEALDAAHAAGVIHRDLKPDNVFVCEGAASGARVKLLDFGIAKLAADDLAHKTQTGLAIGTPRYMSPEQARGKPVDGAADVYALGVIAFELLTGEHLFEGDSAWDLVVKQATAAPRAPSAVAPVPAAVDRPVLAMLEKRPAARPASATEAVEAIARAVAGEPPSSRGLPATRRERLATGAPEEFTATIPVSVDDEATDALGASPASGTLLRPSLAPPAPTELGTPALAPEAARTAAEPASPERPSRPTLPAAARRSPVAAPPAPARRPGAAPSGARALPWALAAVAAGVAVFAVARAGDGPPAAAPSPAAPASEVILHLDVEPRDAVVRLEGRDPTPASAPLVLPRGTQALQLEVRREGHEARTFVVVPDRDQRLATIRLPPLAAPAAAPSPSAPRLAPPRASEPAPSRPKALHRDLDRPPELTARPAP